MIEKKQYFELVNLINKSNKTKNETTEFVFFIETNQLYFGQPNRQKIIIAKQDTLMDWEPAKATKFYELEELVAHIASTDLKNIEQIDALIKKLLFGLNSE